MSDTSTLEESLRGCPSESVDSVTVGGHTYPRINVKSCVVCASPMRTAIEQAIVQGAGYAQTARTYPEARVSAANITAHFAADHLDLTSAAVKRLQGEEASRHAAVAEAGAEVVADHLSFASLIVGRVRERVLSGEVEPNVRDGLKAAQILQTVQQDRGGGWDGEAVQAAFSAFLEVIGEVVGRNQMLALTERINHDPTLTAIIKRANGD